VRYHVKYRAIETFEDFPHVNTTTSQ